MYLPAGTYLITSTIVLPDDFVFGGAGRGCTTLLSSGLGGAMIVGQFTAFSASSAARNFRLTIRNMTINGTSRNTAGGIGFNANQWTQLTLENVRIRSIETGLQMVGVCNYNTFTNCDIHNCKTGLVLDDGVHAFSWHGGRCVSHSTVGIDIGGGTNQEVNACFFYGIAIEDCAIGGRIDGSPTNTTQSVFFIGCRIEVNTVNFTIVPLNSDFQSVRDIGFLEMHAASGEVMVTNDRALRAEWDKSGTDVSSKTSLRNGVKRFHWYRETTNATPVVLTPELIPLATQGIHMSVKIVGIDLATPADQYVAIHERYIHGATPTAVAAFTVDTTALVGAMATASSVIDLTGGQIDIVCTGEAGRNIAWWIWCKFWEGDAA